MLWLKNESNDECTQLFYHTILNAIRFIVHVLALLMPFYYFWFFQQRSKTTQKHSITINFSRQVIIQEVSIKWQVRTDFSSYIIQCDPIHLLPVSIAVVDLEEQGVLQDYKTNFLSDIFSSICLICKEQVSKLDASWNTMVTFWKVISL